MSTFFTIILYFISFLWLILIFLFIFWSKLKEDYDTKTIFTQGFFMVFIIYFSIFCSNLIIPRLHQTHIFNPNGLWFWMSLIAISIAFVIGILKFKFKFYEALEATTLGLFTTLIPIELMFFLFTKNKLFLLQSALILFFSLIYLILNAHYKKITWYRSGRVGFSSLLTLGLFFLTRSIIAIYSPNMLFLLGKVEIVFSAATAFLIFFALYNLSTLNK